VKSQDIIIVVVLILILIPAVRATLTHMKGEGSCCGGPKEKARRKRLPGTPKHVYRFHIEGMVCQNCKNRIENRLNEIPDVVASVKLSAGSAVVRVYGDTGEDLLRETVEKLGYKVTEIL
jgi:copper chaperone CopZ